MPATGGRQVPVVHAEEPCTPPETGAEGESYMMDVSEIRAWLMRGWRIDDEINSLLRQKQEEWERITSITSNLSGVAVDGTKDPHKYDRYSAFDSIIDQRVDELYAVKTEIKETIQKVTDWRYRHVLHYRYEEQMTWEEIAVTMHYYYRHVRRLERKAVEVIGELITNDLE